MTKILIQTQLSNYDSNRKFILECDSGWQMMMGRIRVMLRQDPNLEIHIMGPMLSNPSTKFEGQVITSPLELNKDLFEKYNDRLKYISHVIEPNALMTRYDFKFNDIANRLQLDRLKNDKSLRYDIVYLNDPMQLRNFKALFFIKAGYSPKFVVHSHFIDDPMCPKFPVEASLWLGQCEAAIKADWNFWQCESSMNLFFEQMAKTFSQEVTSKVQEKSEPWDDGYSSEEIRLPYDVNNIRFDISVLKKMASEKVLIFVPNRIGGKGRSSDYTNCGNFMFDQLPVLAELRAAKTGTRDFVVVCGNPSQKILNSELHDWCSAAGYVNLVPGSFNRDEFKCVASHSHVSLGLYNQDSYGGTVARECIELGCLPFWVDNYEYATIARQANYQFLTNPDLTMVPEDLSSLIDHIKNPFSNSTKQGEIFRLQEVVRERCSYEETTKNALNRMMSLI